MTEAPRPPRPYADLLELPMTQAERTAIQALVAHGSQNAAAEHLGWKRTKLQSRLRSVQRRQRAAAAPAPEAPVALGRVSVLPANVAPQTGPVARYILTSAQNNTPVHGPFLANLEAFAEHIGAHLMVSRFTYNKAAFGAKATKAGRHPTAADTAGLWYDPAIEPYICDDPQAHGSCRWQLAPDLVWCAEMNILPTAVRPLSGLETYSGPASGIFPHAKIAMESVPVIGDRPPKFNYTTGAVTQRNYIAKKEGLKGEFHHQYGALLVEVCTATGNWWARQLNATDDGAFQDLRTRVADGEVTYGAPVEAINWGDVHASEIDPQVAECNWRAGGILDALRPRSQFWHDTHSHRNRSHHEEKDFAKRYEKWCGGPETDTVEAELAAAATLLRRAHRPWCTTVVVSSNHDRHGERWLNDADHRKDLPNAEIILDGQRAQVRAIRDGEPFNFLEWALKVRPCHEGNNCMAAGDQINAVHFLARDESFTIGPAGHEIECGQHGDEGPDGARGNTANLSKLSVRMNKGHDHKATIRDGVCSAAVCNRRLAYSHGPSSWSVSHIVTYPSGKRCIITMRAGKCWA